MGAIIPAVDPQLQLAATLQAHNSGQPVVLLERRHVTIRDDAHVLSVVGMTGDNVPLGFAVGDLGAAAPHTIVVVGDPRDPALAVRAGARLADILDPHVAAAVNGGPPLQLLIDSPNTLQFLWSWTFRMRAPWLPGPYQNDPELGAQAERCEDAYALTRAVLAASQVPGDDVIADAVTMLTGHLVFPLAGAQEATQLGVLLACLRHAGAPVRLTALGPAVGTLLDQIEAAEELALSAAADPEWDNRTIVPALTAFKRLRNAAARGNQLRRADPAVCEAAAQASGLTSHVTAQLKMRHAAISQAFEIMRAHPPLPALDGRRQRAAYRVNLHLQRGARHDRTWRDFPRMLNAARDADNNQQLIAGALIEAARGDRRVFALVQARGEAAIARVLRVSPDGRSVDLELDRPLTPRSDSGWWWLDDTHSEPVTGNLAVHPGTAPTRATLTVTVQMRRLAATPTILTAQPRIRLVTLERPFDGRAWWPTPADAVAPPPAPWPAPIDFAALDTP